MSKQTEILSLLESDIKTLKAELSRLLRAKAILTVQEWIVQLPRQKKGAIKGSTGNFKCSCSATFDNALSLKMHKNHYGKYSKEGKGHQ